MPAPSGSAALAADLKKRVTGEVRFDNASRVLYSTDASIYQMMPLGVVFPRDTGDVQAVIEVAREHRAPVLPRGAGTSLSGQTVNQAIVLDFRHMNRVLEVNAAEHWARVEPGMVVQRLNAAAAAHGLAYAPDPTTINRATVGGGIGNNSCGAHSVLYGKTIDHVRGLCVLLSDGSRAQLGALTPDEAARHMAAESLHGQVYREVARLGREHRDEVAARFPKVMRRVSGYNLDDFPGSGPMDLARMVTGSEGTLCVMTEARVNLVPLPARKGLAVLHFHEMAAACDATPLTLHHGPSAVEMIGSMIIERCRESLGLKRLTTFLEGEPDTLLVVEFFAVSERELAQKLAAFKDDMARRRAGYACLLVTEPEGQARVWEMREAGLGLLMSTRGDAKPFPYVEDTAVDPGRLGDYVRRFDQIVRAHGTTAGYYGHASVGCLHIRPLVDLKTEQGVATMLSLAEAVADLVLEFGGALSGEHGDGIVRGVWNEKMFGPRLYQAFREVKRAFDPLNIMNPGKIVDCPPMTENLRFGARYRAASPATHLDFSRDGGLAGAVEMCNGMGACRKDGGVMCPSFMATREEEHSTRGRANLLRGVLTGLVPATTSPPTPSPASGTRGEGTMRILANERLHEALDLCVECKGCKAECQTGVDMAKLKYEFLAAYKQAHGASLRDRLFAHARTAGRVGAAFQPLASRLAASASARGLLERFTGIDRRRALPPFARQTLRRWWDQRSRTSSSHPLSAGGEGPHEVVLFSDTFMNYHHPEVGIAAVEVLERTGLRVHLLDPACCGRPMLSRGFMDEAARNAQANVDALAAFASRGVPILGIEPSCLLALRDEYPDMLQDEPSRLVARNTYLVDEYLAILKEQGKLSLPFGQVQKKVLFHGHCHQKALAGTARSLAVLRLPPGYTVEEVQSGCCGMAGAFGYEKEHYDVSLAMGRLRLAPAIEAKGPEWEVAVTGVSCRQQVEHLTGRKARHLIEVLRDAVA